MPLQNPKKVLWCNRIGKIDGKDGFKVTKNTKICHIHFNPDDITRVPGGSRWSLKPDAAPIKTGKSPYVQKKKPPLPRSVYLTPKKLKFDEEPTSSNTSTTLLQPRKLFNMAAAAVRSYTITLINQNKALQTQKEHMENKLKDTEDILRQKSFGIDVVKTKDEWCKHYTGFPNYNRLKICFDFLDVGSLGENVLLKGSSNSPNGSNRPRSLSPEDQFLMTLVKIRRGFSNIHCSWLFGCSENTVSRIFCSWINYMYLRFSSIPIWPSREEVDSAMPESFKQSFPKTRAILDCTEIRVESTESLHLRSMMYSDYKHHTTYKGLLAITPAGSLSFISELYPGSVSDREITYRCGILNPRFWDSGDELMADKGFTIRDYLDCMGVKLNTPIFLQDNAQFTAKEVCINQKIASQRIHVERYINRIKNFAIFDRPIPLSMHGSVNQIFTVCSFLVMYQDPIISVR